MRRLKFLTTVLMVFALSNIFAQGDTKVFDPDSKLTWLGLDFSKAKFIGDEEALRNAGLPGLIRTWNNLLLDEAKKYDVAKMLHRGPVDINFDPVMTHNDALSLNGAMSHDSQKTRRLTEDSIANIVSRYKFNGAKGTGLMFNVETFSKIDETALVWVTFVDMDTKKVLWTRRMEGKPGGFGLRNFWAGAVYKIMKDIEKTYYTQWSKRP